MSEQIQQPPSRINALKQAAPVAMIASLAIASGETAPVTVEEQIIPPPTPLEHMMQVAPPPQESPVHAVSSTPQAETHKKPKPLKFWYGTTAELHTIKQMGHVKNAILTYKFAVKQPWYNWREMRCLDRLWFRESKFYEHADNPYSDALGIPQANPGNKMRKAGKDWQHNPKTQIKWGIDDYIEVRYVKPCNAWGHSEAYGWY